MENKINIAELLADCPKGMELYSPIFGKVYLNKIRPHLAIVVTTDKEQGDFKEEFLYDGRYGMNGECCIFPSKENRDWSKFQRPFKDGDVVISNRGDIHLLRTEDSSYCAYRESWNALPKFDSTITRSVKVVRHATEEEKKKLFDVINENGYKWNSETKSLENLEKVFELKFKVGDRVQNKNTNMIGTINLIINDEREYQVDLKNGGITYILFEYQDSWELVKDNIKPKFKVGDRIKHKLEGDIYIVSHVISNGYGGGVYDVDVTNELGKSINIEEQDDYELVYNKFDISTLKPFDRVLVRLTNNCIWMPKFFSYYDINSKLKYYPFVITDNIGYPQCIPFEGNEHLLGTTDDCDNYYKIW